MPEYKQNSQTSLTFPENSASIIGNILKKYNVIESNEELLEKWEKDKKSHGEILVDLLIKKLKTNLSSSEFINLIQKELNITTQKAKKIAEDLDKEIITLTIQSFKKNSFPSIGEILSLGK